MGNAHIVPLIIRVYIAAPNLHAFVTTAAISHLERAGLTANKEYRLLRKATHDRTLMAITRREVDAGIMPSVLLSMVDPAIRKGLRVLATIDSLPSDLLLVRKNSAIAKRGDAYFGDFVAGEYGKRFLEEWNASRGIKAISSFDTKALREYVRVTERRTESP